MGSKHHRSKRGRSRSRYPERLEARGIARGKGPTMPTVEKLREKQGTRVYPAPVGDVRRET